MELLAQYGWQVQRAIAIQTLHGATGSGLPVLSVARGGVAGHHLK